MINELYEVTQYLQGKDVTEKKLYRVRYLMAKFYKEQGLQKFEIRDKIFEWGKQHSVYFTFSINTVIYRVFEDNRPLKADTQVYINDEDIEFINSHFDSIKVKTVALAVLCYAKIFADADNEVIISTVDFANWLHMQQPHISARYIPELIDFNMLQRVDSENCHFSWNSKRAFSKNRRYKVNMTLKNEGVYVLANNDILKLAEKIFNQDAASVESAV